jgi:hypothetical protein
MVIEMQRTGKQGAAFGYSRPCALHDLLATVATILSAPVSVQRPVRVRP